MKNICDKPLTINHKLFEDAKEYLVGGVNSPVRSFNAVGGEPVFIRRASGSKLYDEEGNEFIDYCLSWGALILGHAHPEIISSLEQAIKNGTSFGAATKLETELAKLIVEAVPSIEQVRLTNSGTEAVMGAIRLARGFTKKNKIIKFAGSYHGHADYLLVNPVRKDFSNGVKAGSGSATLGLPDSLGVPGDFTKHTIVAVYNDIKEVEKLVEQYQKDLAAIIVEPVMANCGVILPKPGFLQGLRALADKYGFVLIFDEVITGFRLSYGGAQEYFNINSDLTCLGKIVGGGLPIGAFGGKKEIMQLLAPVGEVYQAGTLSGNPIAVTAGLTTLKILKKIDPCETLANKTQDLCEKIKLLARGYSLSLKVNYLGSLFSIFFTSEDVLDYNSAKRQNEVLFGRFFRELLKKGIYLSPSGFEANFLSAAHTAEDIDVTLNSINSAFGGMR